MNWKTYWDKFPYSAQEPLKSVQRTKNGQPLTPTEIEQTVEFALQNTALTTEFVVLDVCCGNGIITRMLSENCKSIVGVDFSEALINNAPKLHNGKYIKADALQIKDFLTNKFDLITIFFSFQYFSKSEGKALLENLSSMLNPSGKIYLSDIPDKEKQSLFAGKGIYKLKYYLKYFINLDQTGRFWKSTELDVICSTLKLKGKKIIQPKHLPYSHYRFDYLITKS